MRTLLTLLLSASFLVEATAQTAPATGSTTRSTTKTTVSTSKKTTRRPVRKVRRTTTKTRTVGSVTPPPVPGTRHDVGPGGNGAKGSAEAADGKGQGMYAAPGMSIEGAQGKDVGGYNSAAPAAKPGNTLGSKGTPR